jgi:1,2-diacylglycerol 3-beta-galactosyltransferase
MGRKGKTEPGKEFIGLEFQKRNGTGGSEGVMVRRIMFVYSDTGGNHRSAADALDELVSSYEGGRHVQVTHADVYRLAKVYLFRTARRRYKILCRHLGLLYAILFRITDNVAVKNAIARVILRVYGGRIAKVIARIDPDVIVVLHPLFVSDVLCDLRSRSGARWRIISLVTDLGVAHAGWVATALDSVLLMSPGQAQKLRSQGCLPPESRVAITKAPVRAAFAAGNHSTDERVMAALGPKPPYVLYVPGLQPNKAIMHQVRCLTDDYRGIGIVLVGEIPRRLAGRLRKINPELIHLDKLSAFEMAVMFRNAKLVAGKAGPAVMAEGASVGAHFLPTAEVGCQEAGNALIGRALYGIDEMPQWSENRRRRSEQIASAHVPPEGYRIMNETEVRMLIIHGYEEMTL